MHILAELSPLDTSTGTRPVLRAASANDRAITGLNGKRWWPAILRKPSLGLQLFQGDFSSSVSTGTATLDVALDALARLASDVRARSWAAAPITLYAGNSGDAWPWDKVFVGIVDTFSTEANRLSITAKVDTTPFDVNVLTATYAGTGGIEGGTDLAGKVKPLIIGTVFNTEPTLIDADNSVYQFSAYGAIEAVDYLYERGSLFPDPLADYATYDALVAADIAAGQWATCLANGLIRLGAPAYGVITADIRGHKGTGFTNLTGAVLQLCAGIAGVDSGLIETATFAALDTAAPYPVGNVITDQITVLDLARAMALPLNAQVGVSWLGKLFVTRVTIGSAAITLDGQGRQLPAVTGITEADVSAPYKRIVFGAAKCWRVHTFDEIASEATLLPRGTYDAATTYRDGNIVTLSDGSQWEYTADDPSSGHAPADGSAYWSRMTSATEVDWATGVSGTGKPDDNATVGATVGSGSTPGNLNKPGGGTYTDDDIDTSKGTSADTANVSGRTAAQVLSDIDAATSGVADLVTTYGSTASAAASASAAEGYADTASTAATNAATAKDDAQTALTAAQGAASDAADSATAASGSATAANTSASNASTSEGNASTSETNAAGSAAAAASSSKVSASNALARGITPNADFTNGNDEWFGNAAGAALPAAISNLASYQGRAGVLKNAAGNYGTPIGAKVPVDTARAYCIKASAYVDSGSAGFYLGFAAFNESGALLTGNGGTYTYLTWANTAIDAGAWEDAVTPPITGIGSANTQFPVGTAFVAPIALMNYQSASASATYLDYLYIEDVTESENAGASATAAATSASTAATKATDASESASTATTQAGIATTKAGNASTSATQAATSASDALGYKNTASTQATNAAGSASDADDSATAASGSASTASTQAGLAGASATAAAGSATSANTAKNDAQTAATTATGAASTATTQAAAATTQATLAAAFAGTRGITPNASYDQGTTGWFDGVSGASGSLTQMTWMALNWGRNNILLNSSGSAKACCGTAMPVDTSRKYRIKAGIYSNGNGGTIYVGLTSRDASNAPVGTNQGLSYALLANNVMASGWHDLVSDVITGEAANASLNFRSGGTVLAAPIALTNYNSTPGQYYAFDYLYIEDVTESEAAASQAGIATSQAAIATAQTALAQQSAILAANVGSGDQNINSYFANWPDAGGFPKNWANNSGVIPGTNMSRVAGITSAYAMRLVSAANVNASFGQTGVNAPWTVTPSSWVIIRVQAILNSGSLSGAGVTLRGGGTGDANIILSTTHDVTGTAVGAGTVGQTYTWEKLVKVPNGAYGSSNLIVFGHYSPYGSTAAANDITWLHAGWRYASDAEIKTGQIDTLSASVSTNATAIAALDANKAAASTVTALQATVGDNTSAITAVQAVAADAKGTADAIVGVKLDVNGKVSGVVSENDGVTSSFSVVADIFEIADDSSGARMTYANSCIKVYDANGTLRVQIGDLSQ